MSQWNNGYSLNSGQYNGDPNMRGDDQNVQYQNTETYSNEQINSRNDYVSFNDFLSQMQSDQNQSGAQPSTNNINYSNYPVNGYEYTNTPSNSQNTNQYNHGQDGINTHSSGASEYKANSRDQYGATLSSNDNLRNASKVAKSNLTATAMEFVPKSAQRNPTHTEPSTSYNKTQNNRYKNYSSDYRKDNGKDRKEANRNQSEPNRSQHSEPNRSHYSDTNRSQHSEPNRSHHSETNRSQYSEPNRSQYSEPNRSQYSEPNRSQYSEPYRSQHSESNRNQQSDNNSQARNHYENSRNQKKLNSKANNKESDNARTFYNSHVSKSSQDVRNGDRQGDTAGKTRNWPGSQRVRPTDRNYTDDEHYASNYKQYHEKNGEANNRAPFSPSRTKSKGAMEQANTEMTQRERLSDQLDKGTLECLVCCERVKQIEPVWSCGNCYHVLHLRCIRKWAISSKQNGAWRCPACQNISNDTPSEYRCMCGAVRTPDYQRGVVAAHTCGQSCRRPRACPHPCTLLCHPGPCPPCQATVTKHCCCGAETRSILCSSKLPQVCSRTCGKKLNCLAHNCTQTCHGGPCEECKCIVNQVCYCPAGKSREVPCSVDTATNACYACGDTCGRVLGCGAHVCRQICHPPPCESCPLLPENVRVCPCGQTLIDKDERKLCTDPIPVCGNICAKPQKCGPIGDRHFCKQECHQGECPVCPDKTVLSCRCSHTNREILCADLPNMIDNVFCQRKCNKKLTCDRHRCRNACCASDSHRCMATCGRLLACQMHRCEELCHTGHCTLCPRVSFSELTCECGLQVVLPPVRCGTRPPACSSPCPRSRPCGHDPHHVCHSGDCPPCVVLTTKSCHGGHEERKTIPCSQEEFSCGLPCGKPLQCGKHTCIKTCHKGPCNTEKCTQPCNEKRPSCGHPCGAVCHATNTTGKCPSSAPCRRPVQATCPCRRRTQQRTCADNTRDLVKMTSALAATKIQEGGSVDLSDINRPMNNLKTLDCDDECRLEARTRSMALALQIRNPDISSKLAPRYSDHVRQWATRDATFAQHVHDKLTDLVQLAKKSKQKTRSHSFPSMNWQKRQFIHELCEHFGCESVAYDAEPNRNVVATADKEKSWLPAMSVLEVLSRESGKRRVPPPVLRPTIAPSPAATPLQPPPAASTSSGTTWAKLTSKNAWAARSQPQPAPVESKPPVIDYFDNPPDNY